MKKKKLKFKHWNKIAKLNVLVWVLLSIYDLLKIISGGTYTWLGLIVYLIICVLSDISLEYLIIKKKINPEKN